MYCLIVWILRPSTPIVDQDNFCFQKLAFVTHIVLDFFLYSSEKWSLLLNYTISNCYQTNFSQFSSLKNSREISQNPLSLLNYVLILQFGLRYNTFRETSLNVLYEGQWYVSKNLRGNWNKINTLILGEANLNHLQEILLFKEVQNWKF